MSASFYLFISVVFIQRNSEAAPVMDYDDPPGGIVKPISGAVPVAVPKSKQGTQNKILKEIRSRVDQVHVSELDSSVRDDIFQDELAPPECVDKYGIRDGALKHFIRGVRDVGGVLVKDFETLGQGRLADLPLVPNVINGFGETLMNVLCGVEGAVSDFVSDGLDEGADLLTKVLVDLLDIEGSAPLQNLPAGIINITKLIGRVGSEAVEDILLGIENGAEDLAAEVASGAQDVVYDVKGAVSGVETDVTSVVNAVDTAVHMVKGGVGSGVGTIVSGLKGGLGTVKGLLR